LKKAIPKKKPQTKKKAPLKKKAVIKAKKVIEPPPPPPILKKAVTMGQVTGLKLNEKDGSWNITVNVQREKVPANIEQWAFQIVAVAVMEKVAEAEEALNGLADNSPWGGLEGA